MIVIYRAKRRRRGRRRCAQSAARQTAPFPAAPPKILSQNLLFLFINGSRLVFALLLPPPGGSRCASATVNRETYDRFRMIPKPCVLFSKTRQLTEQDVGKPSVS